MQKTVLAIDIGSTKICAIIAKIEGESIAIMGADISKASGFKRGSITNIDEASKSIKIAIEGAKRVAGTDVDRAIVSISASYTKNIESSAIVNIPNKEIGIKEINRLCRPLCIMPISLLSMRYFTLCLIIFVLMSKTI